MLESLALLSPAKLRELDSILFADEIKWTPHKPTERQQLFLELDIEEAFYGGAAGGGKSDALLMAALQYVDTPGYAAILFRRTYADLALPEALMSRAREWLQKTPAKWIDKEKTWLFPSGATLTFGYLEIENDKYRYQGSAYQFIGFDELTQFSETQYRYLFSRLRRLSASDIPLRMRSASNPGGIGAQWVHEHFVPDEFTPEQAIEPKVFIKDGKDEDGEYISRVFVPARLNDNPYLDTKTYERSLSMLDPVTRAQLLRGDWSIKERGNILGMWDERVHVIGWKTHFQKAFGTDHIPLHWLLGVYQDWGTTPEHPCVTTWFATAPKNAPEVNGVKMEGSVFIYRGFVTQDATVREVATKLTELMKPHGERSRIRKWQMSHEASSERIAYNREHQLPFSAWETGKTRGIAQLRNALELVETDKPNPFIEGVMGHPRLYHVVDDNELFYPKTDAGLVRHRAEAPAYRWATLRSGEPTAMVVPHALFNDAIDTERAAAADYWPALLPLTLGEKVEQALPVSLKTPLIAAEVDADKRVKLTQAQMIKTKQLVKQMSRVPSRSLVGKYRNFARGK